MVNKCDPDQISIDDFVHPFGQKLSRDNRWVELAEHIPWKKFRAIYNKSLIKDFGRPAKDARLVIGAMIIKHKKGLPDEEVIPEIQENPYLQFFVGLKVYTYKPIFDPSLFVTLRKRLGRMRFDEMSKVFIDEVAKLEKTHIKKKPKKRKKNKSDDDSNSSKSKTHNGQLIIDAVVAPQDIKYPTDLELLSDAREHTERIIDELWEPGPGKRKPRTYRKIARKEYLLLAKKKRKGHKERRKAIRKQLGYLNRNIKTIKKFLEPYAGSPFPLDRQDQKLWWVIQHLYDQQKTMYDTKINKHPDRIVSLRQPHVRPIVRGKARNNTEFGAKLSCSLVDGNIFLDHLSWDAFNEKQDLILQVESYKNRFGYYPESVHADHIYGTRENRRYLKDRNIKYYGKALGRPPKLSKAEKDELIEGLGIRNLLEGKFGEGKRKYQLDLVMAKTPATSESWIACVMFVMNLANWSRTFIFALFHRLIARPIKRLLRHFKEQRGPDFVASLA